jgi:hypothetical protein
LTVYRTFQLPTLTLQGGMTLQGFRTGIKYRVPNFQRLIPTRPNPQTRPTPHTADIFTESQFDGNFDMIPLFQPKVLFQIYEILIMMSLICTQLW